MFPYTTIILRPLCTVVGLASVGSRSRRRRCRRRTRTASRRRRLRLTGRRRRYTFRLCLTHKIIRNFSTPPVSFVMIRYRPVVRSSPPPCASPTICNIPPIVTNSRAGPCSDSLAWCWFGPGRPHLGWECSTAAGRLACPSSGGCNLGAPFPGRPESTNFPVLSRFLTRVYTATRSGSELTFSRAHNCESGSFSQNYIFPYIIDNIIHGSRDHE